MVQMPHLRIVDSLSTVNKMAAPMCPYKKAHLFVLNFALGKYLETFTLTRSMFLQYNLFLLLVCLCIMYPLRQRTLNAQRL